MVHETCQILDDESDKELMFEDDKQYLNIALPTSTQTARIGADSS